MKEYCGVKAERTAWVVNLLQGGVEEVGVLPRRGHGRMLAVLTNGDARLIAEGHLCSTRACALNALLVYLLARLMRPSKQCSH